MTVDFDPASTRDRPRPAILLLGHGSHVDARSSDSVHHLARRLRATGRYPEVRVAFWKEEPQLRHAFLLVESSRVVAVPFFTSEGYFTDRVLPRELRIRPPVSDVQRVARSGEARDFDSAVRVHYTRAVGAHPAMGDAVLERALDRLSDEGILEAGDTPPSDVTLVVLGHGTERHPASGEIVEAVTDRLARKSSFHRVTCCFLDQDPRMLAVLESLDARRAVLVPFFMAEGWHVGQTIPRDLNLEAGRSRVGGTEVLFTDPVGTHPAVARVVERMVEEAAGRSAGRSAEESAEESTEESPGKSPGKSGGRAGQTGEPPDPSEPGAGGEAPGEAGRAGSLPARARRAFLDWIDGGGEEGRVFLQTRVAPQRRREDSDVPGSRGEPSLYEIRHVADRGMPGEALDRSRDPERARTLAGRTDDGDHRPLKTAPNLGRGWLLERLDARQVWEAYAHLYPVAPVHWYLGRRGELPVIPFRETAARQTGIYAIVDELGDGEVLKTRRETCEAGCLRRVRWPLEASEGLEPGVGKVTSGPESPDPGPSTAAGEVPCPEPCSFFVTRAREKFAENDEH